MNNTLFTPNDATTPRLRTGSKVAGVVVTVKTSESHTYNANVTKLALESGAIVSDHMILEPETVAVSFAMTNAGDGASAAKDAFATFVKMQRDRQLVELVTEHAVYTNMVCTNITPMHSAPYKGSLVCTATFSKIYFVEMVSAGRAPSQLKANAKGAAGKTQSGKVEPQETKRSGAVQASGKWLDSVGLKKEK